MQFSLLASIAAVYAIFIYEPSEPQREVVSVPVAVEYQTAKTWRCPSCSPEEKYVLKQLQEKQKFQIVMPLLRSWEILNRKVSSIPTF